jgi:DNA-binding SARP family transcriptional activator
VIYSFVSRGILCNDLWPHSEMESACRNLGKLLSVSRTGFELRTNSRAMPLQQSILS